MTRLKPWLLLLLVFLAGVAAGSFGTRIFVRHTFKSWTRNPEAMRERVEEDLVRELDLTSEQQEKVHDILTDSHERMKALRDEFHPRFAEIMDSSEKRIRATLTPEQQEHFEQFLKEKKQLWRPGGPPPSRRPPPPESTNR
jgi:Spy/CpxP family protein refolding chaperone